MRRGWAWTTYAYTHRSHWSSPRRPRHPASARGPGLGHVDHRQTLHPGRPVAAITPPGDPAPDRRPEPPSTPARGAAVRGGGGAAHGRGGARAVRGQGGGSGDAAAYGRRARARHAQPAQPRVRPRAPHRAPLPTTAGTGPALRVVAPGHRRRDPLPDRPGGGDGSARRGRPAGPLHTRRAHHRAALRPPGERPTGRGDAGGTDGRGPFGRGGRRPPPPARGRRPGPPVEQGPVSARRHLPGPPRRLLAVRGRGSGNRLPRMAPEPGGLGAHDGPAQPHGQARPHRPGGLPVPAQG